MSPPKIAMVAALEREVWPLVKNWAVSRKQYEGRWFSFFENGQTVLVCGGIGAEAARRATEAIIVLYRPERVQSVGFAGALDPEMSVGEVIVPCRIIDANDGSRVETGATGCTLVSIDAIIGAEQKAKLAKTYGAKIVDMEAAAVARGAQTHNLPFSAVKVISDKWDFAMPPMQRFIDCDGNFRTGRFVLFTVVRPWLWPIVIQLGRNSALAARNLCEWLEQKNQSVPAEQAGLQSMAAGERHP